MHPWLRPALRAAAVYDIDVRALVARGVRGIILDLDNTIVPWGATEAPQPLVSWIGRLRASGLALCIVSNNGGPRVTGIARSLNVPVLTGAMKPLGRALRRALALMGTTESTTALVGDQLFTDVLGGNRLGLYTVLVEPQGAREFILTRLVRLVERVVLRRLG